MFHSGSRGQGKFRREILAAMIEMRAVRQILSQYASEKADIPAGRPSSSREDRACGLRFMNDFPFPDHRSGASFRELGEPNDLSGKGQKILRRSP